MNDAIEQRVLDAVRVLVRATAREVAERSGQPNGSVVVVLRALAARGLVAKAQTSGTAARPSWSGARS